MNAKQKATAAMLDAEAATPGLPLVDMLAAIPGDVLAQLAIERGGLEPVASTVDSSGYLVSLLVPYYRLVASGTDTEYER